MFHLAKIIVFTNQKGGIGKTTTSAAVIAGLTQRGKRVLGIDLDPQGNLGFSFGVNIEETNTVYDVFKGTVEIGDAISKTEYGDILPSNILLSGCELEFNRPGREFLLKDALAGIKGLYDYIIIDTPPALNILTVNAYVCSNSIVLPMVPEILSLVGISQIKDTINTVKKFYNPELEILGILFTKYNKRTILTRDVEEMATIIAKELGTSIFETKIRSSVVVAESPAHGETILTYAPKSNPAVDYQNFVDELIKEVEG